jgi:hypothetical protein
MNSAQHNIPANGSGREALGVIARIVAILATSFAFAAFSSTPAQPQSDAESGQPVSVQIPNLPH